MPEFTSVGPEGYSCNHYTTTIELADVSNNTNIIQIILDSYEFDGPLAETTDCSNISEIIWYIMNFYGFNAKLVGNAGVYDGNVSGHMFVYVLVGDGTVVIDPTIGLNENRIGTIVVPPTGSLWSKGWVWDSPTEFLKVGHQDDMRGITLDTPIEELPIRRKS